jgi:hypothetical protein
VDATLGFIAIFLAIAVPLGIERLKRPSFDFAVADPGCSDTGDPGGPLKYLNVTVFNDPIIGPLLRNTATGCIASLTYSELSATAPPPLLVPARWSARPEPDDNPRMLEQAFHLDLEPSDQGAVIPVAMKYAKDPEAYAVSRASYEPDAYNNGQRATGLALRGRDYKLTVAVEAGGLKRNADFRLYNHGGHDGFRLVMLALEHPASRAALSDYLKYRKQVRAMRAKRRAERVERA